MIKSKITCKIGVQYCSSHPKNRGPKLLITYKGQLVIFAHRSKGWGKFLLFPPKTVEPLLFTAQYVGKMLTPDYGVMSKSGLTVFGGMSKKPKLWSDEQKWLTNLWM